MSYEHISFEQTDGVANLTLQRPASLNAFNVEMVDEITHAIDRVRDEGTARVLVMTGAGRAFSSGDDLVGRSLAGDAGSVLEKDYNPMIGRLFGVPRFET